MLEAQDMVAALQVAFDLKSAKEGTTKADMARHFDVKPQSINDWFRTGRIGKSREEKLIEFFADVVGPEHWGRPKPFLPPPQPEPDTDLQPDGEMIPLKLNWVPVIGRAMGGEGDSYYEEWYEPGDADGYVLFPTNDPDAFGTHIVGRSMEPRYRHGEIVIVTASTPAETGDDVLVRFKDGRRMCKQVILREDGTLVLESVNSAYRSIQVKMEELLEENGLLVIIGRAPRKMFHPKAKGI